jgi:hypothetical protein
LHIPDDLVKDNRIFIRIDDVYELSDELLAILKFCQKFNLFISLEIIPYLTTIQENDLLPFDPYYENIIVSQHGYNHVLDINSLGVKRSEFNFSAVDGSAQEKQNLISGKKIMEERYPKRYKHGFSAPFDGYPSWLQNYWGDNGYHYITAINLPGYITFPNIRASVDIWDWQNKAMRPIDVIYNAILNSIKRNKYYGIVIHPIHFKSKKNIDALERILADLAVREFKKFNFINRLTNHPG